MAGPYQHGKGTYVGAKLAGAPSFTDISGYVNTSTLPWNREEHETTTYGPSKAKTFQGGNTDQTFDMGGRWNSAFAAIIEPLVDADQIVIRWGKRGSANGMPYKEFTGFITKYEDPADSGDVDQWSATVRADAEVTDGVFP